MHNALIKLFSLDKVPIVPLFIEANDVAKHVAGDFEHRTTDEELGIAEKRLYRHEHINIFVTLWNNHVHQVTYHIFGSSKIRQKLIFKRLFSVYAGKSAWMKPVKTAFTTFVYRSDGKAYATLSGGPGLLYYLRGKPYFITGIPTFRSNAFVEAQHEARAHRELIEVLETNMNELFEESINNGDFKFRVLMPAMYIDEERQKRVRKIIPGINTEEDLRLFEKYGEWYMASVHDYSSEKYKNTLLKTERHIQSYNYMLLNYLKKNS